MNQHIRALAEQAGMRSPDLFKLTVAHMSVDTLQEFAQTQNGKVIDFKEVV